MYIPRRYFDQDMPSAYSIAVVLFTFNGRRCFIWHRCIAFAFRTYIVVIRCGQLFRHWIAASIRRLLLSIAVTNVI